MGKSETLPISIGIALATVRQNGGMPIFTVYDHPRDFPEHFVVRMHVIYPGEGKSGATLCAWTFGEFEWLRKALEEHGLVQTERHPDDDVAILEIWL